jgi:hypothetical protein
MYDLMKEIASKKPQFTPSGWQGIAESLQGAILDILLLLHQGESRPQSIWLEQQTRLAKGLALLWQHDSDAGEASTRSEQFLKAISGQCMAEQANNQRLQTGLNYYYLLLIFDLINKNDVLQNRLSPQVWQRIVHTITNDIIRTIPLDHNDDEICDAATDGALDVLLKPEHILQTMNNTLNGSLPPGNIDRQASAYCWTAMLNAAKHKKEEIEARRNPDFHNIKRQVAKQLRSLETQSNAANLAQQNDNDVITWKKCSGYKTWGLRGWLTIFPANPTPIWPIDQVSPTLLESHGFIPWPIHYRQVLPRLIPLILACYGAPLNAKTIATVVAEMVATPFMTITPTGVLPERPESSSLEDRIENKNLCHYLRRLLLVRGELLNPCEYEILKYILQHATQKLPLSEKKRLAKLYEKTVRMVEYYHARVLAFIDGNVRTRGKRGIKTPQHAKNVDDREPNENDGDGDELDSEPHEENDDGTAPDDDDEFDRYN